MDGPACPSRPRPAFPGSSTIAELTYPIRAHRSGARFGPRSRGRGGAASAYAVQTYGSQACYPTLDELTRRRATAHGESPRGPTSTHTVAGVIRSAPLRPARVRSRRRMVHRRLHCRAELTQTEPTCVTDSVDEERRRAGHTAGDARHRVPADLPLDRVRADVLDEPVDVETDRARVEQETRRVERVLVGEEHRVHRPEPPLEPGRLCSLRRRERMGVDLDEREVSEDERQVVRVPPPEVLDDRVCLSAVRAFEVAVLDQHHGCIRTTSDVVFLVDLEGQAISRVLVGCSRCVHGSLLVGSSPRDYPAVAGIARDPHRT